MTQILESVVSIKNLSFERSEQSYTVEALSMLDQAQDSPLLDKG